MSARGSASPGWIGTTGVRPHRAGSVKGVHSRDMLELVGPHGSQQCPHRPAFELEHAERVAPGQQLVSRLIFQWQRLKVDDNATVRLNASESIVEHGEVPQAEEVHLQQAEVFTARVVELG